MVGKALIVEWDRVVRWRVSWKRQVVVKRWEYHGGFGEKQG